MGSEEQDSLSKRYTTSVNSTIGGTGSWSDIDGNQFNDDLDIPEMQAIPIPLLSSTHLEKHLGRGANQGEDSLSLVVRHLRDYWDKAMIKLKKDI